jgi:UDP-2,4-diacetamido-2,4,6-trideoxy-beta-L-altropyranose hydrolase
VRILLRADGDATIGTGHVMRMLALADGAHDHEVRLLTAWLDPALEARVRKSGLRCDVRPSVPGSDEDVDVLLEEAARWPADWIVADGYAFSDAYREAIRGSGRRLAFMDDAGHRDRCLADLVVNASPTASREAYGNDAEVLLGPAFALIRRELLDARRDHGTPPRADRILVTMGGADPAGATEQVIDALSRIDDADLRVRIVVGPSNPRAGRLEGRRAIIGGAEIVVGADMGRELANAELAVAAAGITAFELAYFGVPAILIVAASNQADTARGMAALGAAIEHARPELRLEDLVGDLRRDAAVRASMSARGRAIVDGRGAERILAAMRAGG